jgi:hypothetical protein
MSFLAAPSPPDALAEAPIVNNGFWPDVDPVALRKDCRLDGTVTVERLRHSLLIAITDVNELLQSWQDAQVLAGHATAGSVPASSVGGQKTHLIQYRAAIISHVQADLAERYRDFDTTGQGDTKADELQTTVDAHRRNMHWAIASITKTPRTTVELI